MVGRAHVHDPQIWEDAGNVRVHSHVSFWAQHTELSGHRAMGRGRKGESAEHQGDPGSSQHIGSGVGGHPPLTQKAPWGTPTLLGTSCGFVLRFSGISQQRVERFRMAVAAMWAASASCV